MKLNELYKLYKGKKPLLMSNEIIVNYPAIKDNTSNFVKDYLENYEYYDMFFSLKFGEADLLYEPDAWIDMCNSIIMNSMTSLSRVYYALSIVYNPTHNYDGKSTTTTTGIISKDMGNDTTTYTHGEKKSTDSYGSTKTDTINATVPYDATDIYKNTDKATVNGDPFENSTTEQSYIDVNDIEYGKETSADYIVTEEKGGNLGVTTTTQMLEGEWNFRKKDFFNMIYEKIYTNLLMWGYDD